MKNGGVFGDRFQGRCGTGRKMAGTRAGFFGKGSFVVSVGEI